MKKDKALVLMLGLASTVGQTASADIAPPPQSLKLPGDQKSFATVPITEKKIVVLAEKASVNISRSAGVQEITVSSNSPGNWNVQDGFVRQAVICGGKGVGIKMDALGSRAIVNGVIYPRPDGPMTGLQLKSDAVYVNGEKVKPLQGSGEPRTSGQPDSLTITVPDSYTGSLSIGCGGDSQITLSDWKGGDVSLTLIGDSSITAGKLSALDKAVVDNRSTGKASIQRINAKIFVANLQGAGVVNVNNGAAEMSNATVTGTGIMTLKGNFKNLKQAVQGTGKIEVIN